MEQPAIAERTSDGGKVHVAAEIHHTCLKTCFATDFDRKTARDRYD